MSKAAAPTVETTGGLVRGVARGRVISFKGIPYGAKTSGEGRFRPPRAHPGWSGVRECSEYGASCPQMTVDDMLGVALPRASPALTGTLRSERVTGEDCLAANVWTPSTSPPGQLPVLVWLHGGGWSTGSASWPLYDFANLAARGEVVVVSLNHRLGILGFLDLRQLGDEFADSGNVGMLDLVAGLAWVGQNIASFGGDPGNVTVFGESGGGAKVSTLLAMPAARGLFQKAVAMSGATLAATSPERALANTEAVLALPGMGSGPGQLGALDVSRFVEAEIALPGRAALTRGRGFGPVLGPSLPQHPEEALRSGLSSGVTLVSGCTKDEMYSFLVQDPGLWTLSFEDLRLRVNQVLGSKGDHVVDAYRTLFPGRAPGSLLIEITTDAMYQIPQVRLAEAQAEGGSSTFVYLWAWGPPDVTGCRRAGHGSDMAYFFDTVEQAPASAGPHAPALTAMARGALIALAHTGSPGHEGLPPWPAFSAEGHPTMCFDLPATTLDDPLREKRPIWETIRLPGLRGG